jgi:osmotically-inducible protein OsmY
VDKRYAIAAVLMGLCALPAAKHARADFSAVQVAENADNTGRNERDRDGGTITPIDQGSGERDVAITREIRKAVVAQKSFSADAKNVKIITRDGVVTLRGPVETANEKTMIESLAARSQGVKRVDNQIEIANKD